MVEHRFEVLMMEDDEGDVRLAKESLKESKLVINLNVVPDGQEGILYLKKQGKYANARTPELILLDLIFSEDIEKVSENSSFKDIFTNGSSPPSREKAFKPRTILEILSALF